MHMMCIIQTYTSFGAAQRPESLMLGTEHRILYTIWLKSRTGSSSSSDCNPLVIIIITSGRVTATAAVAAAGRRTALVDNDDSAYLHMLQ
jgi:hypothetical protein